MATANSVPIKTTVEGLKYWLEDGKLYIEVLAKKNLLVNLSGTALVSDDSGPNYNIERSRSFDVKSRGTIVIRFMNETDAMKLIFGIPKDVVRPEPMKVEFTY